MPVHPGSLVASKNLYFRRLSRCFLDAATRRAADFTLLVATTPMAATAAVSEKRIYGLGRDHIIPR